MWLRGHQLCTTLYKGATLQIRYLILEHLCSRPQNFSWCWPKCWWHKRHLLHECTMRAISHQICFLNWQCVLKLLRILTKIKNLECLCSFIHFKNINFDNVIWYILSQISKPENLLHILPQIIQKWTLTQVVPTFVGVANHCWPPLEQQ